MGARGRFFWLDNDKDLKVCFIVTLGILHDMALALADVDATGGRGAS